MSLNEDAESDISIELVVNGEQQSAQTAIDTTLQSLLHQELGFREVRRGCGEGVCGACTVLLDDKPVCSCLLLAVQASGKKVITAAGLDTPGSVIDVNKAEALKQQLLARESFQCGYCACGVTVSAAHLVSVATDLTEKEIASALSGNVCRCTGYKPFIESVSSVMQAEPPAFSERPREDMLGRMDGTFRYPTDRFKQQALVGKVLWSEWPAAEIESVDISEAKAIPGVEAVLTYKDIPGKNRAGNGTIEDDQPLLASHVVRSRADAIALVAAQSEAAAKEAIKRIRVSYKQRESVTNPRAALAPDAPRVHANKKNVISDFLTEHGDIGKAFKAADVIVSGTFGCNSNDHACMEPEGGSGWLDEENKLVLAVPSQTPHTVRKFAARVLGRDESSVQVEAPRSGGSFGKYLMTNTEGYLALLVEKTRKPVRLVLERAEALSRAPKRHTFTGNYRLGLKRDGTMVALEADLLVDAGAYTALTPTIVSLLAVEAAGAYEIPNIKIWARGVLTNNLISAPMRGYGSQQVTFGIESLVEKAAAELGMEPDELRRRNFLESHFDGRGSKQHHPEIKQGLTESLEKVKARLGSRPTESTEGWRVGRGFASTHAKYGYPYGLVDRFVAKVSVDASGKWIVSSDIGDAGTGFTGGLPRLIVEQLRLSQMPSYTIDRDALDDPSGIKLASGKRAGWLSRTSFQLIERAQRMGAKILRDDHPVMRVMRRFRLSGILFLVANGSLTWLKNRKFPFGVDTFLPRVSGSRSFYMAGRAALDAAERIKQLGIKLTSESFGVAADQIKLVEDGFAISGNTELRVSWKELASRSPNKRLEAVGEAHLPKGRLLANSGNQVGPVDFMDGTHGCDVAVHEETGEVRILRYVACHDVGKAHDKNIIRGQILGGIAMGIGQALLEHLDVRDGVVQNQGIHEYGVPTALDVPGNIEIELLESGYGLGPDGAKGVGEAGAVAAPSAVVNAIYDALGAQIETIPATPEIILERFLAANRASAEQ